MSPHLSLHARPLSARKTLALGALLIALLLAACDKKAPSGSASQSGGAASGAAAVNWSGVKPSPEGDAILAYKTLARACDAWHKGGKPRITLRHDGQGHVSDDAGNTRPLLREDWRAIVRLVRAPGDPHVAVASKSDFYAGSGPFTDNFGLLARYKYTIELIDDSTLVFRNDGLHDGGR